MAFTEYSHILWGAKQPTLVFTDNKSVTRFFQTKTIPPALWNECDYVLQFNFEIVHVSGKINTAADFLSRLGINPHEKLHLTLRDDIKTTAIQVHIESGRRRRWRTNIFPTRGNKWNWRRNMGKEKKTEQRSNTKRAIEQIQSHSSRNNPNKYKYDSIWHWQRQGRKPESESEQDADIILKNNKNKILNQEYDQQLLKTDPRAKQYEKHAERVILKNGLLVQKYYNETGRINHYQIPYHKHGCQYYSNTSTEKWANTQE